MKFKRVSLATALLASGSLFSGCSKLSFSQNTSVFSAPIVELARAKPTSGACDLAVVIDNSGSMADEQSILASNVDLFLDRIQRLSVTLGTAMDVHVIALRTDDYRLTSIPSNRVTSTNDAGFSVATRQNFLPGITGNGTELVRQSFKKLFDSSLSLIRPNNCFVAGHLTDEKWQSSDDTPAAMFADFNAALARVNGVSQPNWSYVGIHGTDPDGRFAQFLALVPGSYTQAITSATWGEDFVNAVASRIGQILIRNQYDHVPLPGCAEKIVAVTFDSPEGKSLIISPSEYTLSDDQRAVLFGRGVLDSLPQDTSWKANVRYFTDLFCDGPNNNK